MDAPVKKSAGRQDHRRCAEAQPDLRDGTDDAVALHQEVVDGLLEEPQVRLVLQPLPYGGAVEHTVGLGPCGPHCRPLAAVQDAELDARFVGGRSHRAAQGIDFLDQVALAYAADAGVAAHLPQGLDVVRQQQGAATHATTDHDDIELLRVQHGKPLQMAHAAGRTRVQPLILRGCRHCRVSWRCRARLFTRRPPAVEEVVRHRVDHRLYQGDGPGNDDAACEGIAHAEGNAEVQHPEAGRFGHDPSSSRMILVCIVAAGLAAVHRVFAWRR